MEQDHLPCSCDQEVFERVWRRVMPEDRPDCPFTLGEDAAAPPAVQPPAAALPAVVHTAPAGEQAPSRPVVGEEHDVPCLGASSAVYGAQLQRLIDRELADWRAYQALSRRAQGNSGRVLATIAADERRHAKRLSTAYFLISGVRYWPVDRVPNPSPAPFSAALREHFMEEQRGRPPTRPRRRRPPIPASTSSFWSWRGRRTPTPGSCAAYWSSYKNTPGARLCRAAGACF
ncbi:MAG: rubrerythrin [Flavonifractor plautii]